MQSVKTTEIEIRLRYTADHPKQDRLVKTPAKRIVGKAGRRGGKTVGSAKRAAEKFLEGHRVLYAAPTATQCDAFWFEICLAFKDAIEAGVYKKNESERYLEKPGTKQRIKAKTAWNADTLRGDYADELILDEFQMMNESAWEDVGQPMLMDNNGNALFIFTPPSLASTGVSKAKDPRHASKLFREHKDIIKSQREVKGISEDDPAPWIDDEGIWEVIHFTSHDNPNISKEGIMLATEGMSKDSYRREILAEDDEIENSWLVYGVFNDQYCKVNPFNIPNDWPVYSGHDFGSANPAALFIAQNPGPDEMRLSSGAWFRKGDLVIFKEYLPGGGHSTATHVEEWKSWNLNVKRSVGGNPNTEDEIRQGYTKQGWHIIQPRIGRVKTQIDRVRALMEDNKLFIFSDCFNLLGEISNCLWKINDDLTPTEFIKDEAKYHLLASLRYIGSDFTPDVKMGIGSGKVAGRKVGVIKETGRERKVVRARKFR